LFKFIDSRDRLSVQVHPDDALAAKYENSTGKTEAWYVIQCGLAAYVYVGFKHPVTRDRVVKLAAEGKLTGEMHKYLTKKGDGYYIPSGTVHSIGPGNIIFEIQQNSSVTYRLYDWGRKNLGIQRDLQPGPGSDRLAGKSSGKTKKHGGIKVKQLASCGLFSASEIRMGKGSSYFCENESPLVLALMYGELEIQGEGEKYRFKKGAVVMVPAALGAFMIRAARKTKFVITEVK
jgi:mannose-6-phosphate isomerase